MQSSTQSNNQPYTQPQAYQQYHQSTYATQKDENQGAWVPLKPMAQSHNFGNSQNVSNAFSAPLLNPQQYGNTVTNSNGYYNTRPDATPFEPPHHERQNLPAFRSLEAEYHRFRHFSIVNVALGIISIIGALASIFLTVFQPKGTSNYGKDDGNLGGNHFTSQEKALVCLIAVVLCVIDCIIYYYGKIAYDTKNISYLKYLFIVYCVLFVFSLLSTSLFNALALAYLAFCSYKLRMILEEMERIQSTWNV